MFDRFDPLEMQLTTYTLEYLQDIYDKYKKVADLRTQSMPDTLKQAQAAILTKNDFFFFRVLKIVKFNYDLELITIKDEWHKILGYIMRDKELLFTADYIEIDGIQYPHDEYNEFFPFQNSMIEFIALSLITKKVIAVEERINNKYSEKELLNLAEAKMLTGYTGKRLHLISQVLPKNGENYSERRFNRQNLIDFVYRCEATSLEELF